jgi:MFS family permease
MDTTVTATEQEQRPPTLLERLLINRNYAYNWVGLATSRLGNVIFRVSLLLWVATTLAHNAPWTAFAIGGLVFVPTAVALISGTFAGVYVDRWDARRTQLFMDASRAIVFILLMLSTILIPRSLPPGSDLANLVQLLCVYLTLIYTSACDPFVNSSLNVILYDIVDEPNLPRAFGRGQVLVNLGTILGPAIGAGFFFLLGIQWCILLNVLSFVVSFAAFFMVRIPRKAKEQAEAKEAEGQQEGAAKKPGNRFLNEFIEGIRFAFGNRLIVSIAFAMILNTIGGAGIGIFDLFFATNNLHATPQVYAYLDVVMGVGAILGAIFVGPWLRPRIGMARAYWMSGVANGLILFLYARLTNLTAAFVVLFVFGVSQAVFSVAFGPILFRATPRGKMGRVNSVLAQVFTVMSLLSVSFIPFLVTVPLRDKYLSFLGQLFGPIDSLFMAVGILMITSALYLRVTLNYFAPALKRPLQQGGGPPPPVQEEPSPQSRRRALQQQVAICAGGIALAILIVVPVGLTQPANASNALLLSRGQPARGQPVNGIPCTSVPGTAQLANIHLTVYVNGQQAGIPVGIGSVAPPQPGVSALASNGNNTCAYPLRVLENDNIIHVASAFARHYTLGDFFAIWGQPLGSTRMADYTADAQHPLTFTVFDENGNTREAGANPQAIPLLEHETIVIRYNSSEIQPASFHSWNGL